jgi:hypothetical protein
MVSFGQKICKIIKETFIFVFPEQLFDLNIDECLRLDMLAIHGPRDALVGGQPVGVDLQVRRDRLEDLLFRVELRVRISDEAFHLDDVAGLAAFRRVENLDLGCRIIPSLFIIKAILNPFSATFRVGNCNNFYFTIEFKYRMRVQIVQIFESD